MAGRQVDDTAALLHAVAAGDRQAWSTLVERYAGLLWSVARSYRLSDADAADVLQTAWLRLIEHAERISDPERLGAWLATVVRNEIHRLHRKGSRLTPVDQPAVFDAAVGPVGGADTEALRAERDRQLWESFATLSDRCQELLRAVVTGSTARDPLSYREASVELGIPVGGIGPTRMRCLEALRGKLQGSGISGEPEDS